MRLSSLNLMRNAFIFHYGKIWMGGLVGFVEGL